MKIWLALILCLVFAGCGRRANHPPTFPVRGTVTANGKPLAGAIVAFRPLDPRAGQRPANGKTDSYGRYELMTYSEDDGAMAGEYGVTVLHYPVIGESSAGPDQENQYLPPEGPLPVPGNQLPKKYADPKTSGMSAVVSPDGENVFDFSIE